MGSSNLRRPRANLFGVCGGLALIAALWATPASAQPANDECVNATVIPADAPPFAQSVDTTAATSNPADPSLSCNGSGAQTDGNTVWYTWTPSETVTVNINTLGSVTPAGSELDTAHGVYTGTCGNLTEVACVDQGLTDSLFFTAEAGTTYYIKFGEFLDGVGGGTLQVSVDPPPPPQQFILESVADGVSPPIRDLVAFPATSPLVGRAGLAPLADIPMVEVPNKFGVTNFDAPSRSVLAPSRLARGDALRTGTSNAGRDPRIGVMQVFDGVENDDNGRVLGGFIAPPDTIGDVGRNYYVQMSNLVTEIFDKEGNSALGPFANNLFWTGLGGLCETTNRGDPIIMYDEETQRWFVSQFAFQSSAAAPWSICIAISATSDPMGAYYQHEFDFSGLGFPDYPKFGFADSAISVMINLFNPFNGSGMGAIDKDEAMTAGQTTMVFFLAGELQFGQVPGDFDGFATKVPPTFFTNNGGAGDTIDIWEIEPDWETPTNSTIEEVARIPVTPFEGDLCPSFRETCIAQPGSGTGVFPDNVTFLEAISDRMMHRAQMRRFGRNIHALVNHTVDADGNGTAGVRWYEFRKHPRRGWELLRESTFSPDTDNRWMASIAMTTDRDVCIAYSVSSQETHPSIGVACDRAGGGTDMREVIAFDGNPAGNVQRQTSRWGDYSALMVDPVDDSFWFTTEIAEPNQLLQPPVNPERFGWGTKIIQFGTRQRK